MTMVDLPDVDIDVRTTDDEDHDKVAHIVKPAYKVTESYVTGAPVTALCGKTWVPSRDPERYSVCSKCKEIHELSQAFNQ